MKIAIECGESYPTYWISKADEENEFDVFVDVTDEQAERWFTARALYREFQGELEAVCDAFYAARKAARKERP